MKVRQAGNIGTGLILLAAGASTRMGQPKQLLPFRGQSLLRHVALAALEVNCRPLVVVLGAYAARIRPGIEDLPLEIAINADWQSGMAGSIRTGLARLLALAPQSQGALCMLADQPLVTAGLLNRLIEGWQKGSKGIVACAYHGVMGVPALFDRKYFKALQALQGQAGARSLIRAHAADCLPVAFEPAASDLDTPEDYARLMRNEGRI